MPELAEVEFFRKRWHQAAIGQRIISVETHDHKRVLRGVDAGALRKAITGRRFVGSEARAKQMLFQFEGSAWLGVHLGMSGDLSVRPVGHVAGRHDHLVLRTARHALVFADPRMFGRILFEQGASPPEWWRRIAPSVLAPEFSLNVVAHFLQRRGRTPIKAVLLMQERFPGVGNWMADEILWRSGIHPAQKAGDLDAGMVRRLWRETRQVARQALTTIAGQGAYLPPDLNAHIPKSWLFWHRWQDGGVCPRTKKRLARAEIGGRTTCWSPARQKLLPSARGKSGKIRSRRGSRR